MVLDERILYQYKTFRILGNASVYEDNSFSNSLKFIVRTYWYWNKTWLLNHGLGMSSSVKAHKFIPSFPCQNFKRIFPNIGSLMTLLTWSHIYQVIISFFLPHSNTTHMRLNNGKYEVQTLYWNMNSWKSFYEIFATGRNIHWKTRVRQAIQIIDQGLYIDLGYMSTSSRQARKLQSNNNWQ